MTSIKLNYIRHLDIDIGDDFVIEEVSDDIIEGMICLSIWIKNPEIKVPDNASKEGLK